jgi:hypothetical protein
MDLKPGIVTGRRILLLAPQRAATAQFEDVARDEESHDAVLHRVQRLRGSVYVEEGVLTRDDLTEDGRHVHPADQGAWHIVTLDHDGEVVACCRMSVHDAAAPFDSLAVSGSALARSSAWGEILQEAVRLKQQSAAERGLKFAEVGGWAVSPKVRCTTEATRMVLIWYALADVLGIGVGISPAIARRSAPILRRLGGQPLSVGSVELPSFYEPVYRTDLTFLSFDVSHPAPAYERNIAACRSTIRATPVICPDELPLPTTWIDRDTPEVTLHVR